MSKSKLIYDAFVAGHGCQTDDAHEAAEAYLSEYWKRTLKREPSDGEIYAAVSRKMADHRADLAKPAAQPFGVPTVVDDDEGKPVGIVLGHARTGPITESLSDTDNAARRKIEGEE